MKFISQLKSRGCSLQSAGRISGLAVLALCTGLVFAPDVRGTDPEERQIDPDRSASSLHELGEQALDEERYGEAMEFLGACREQAEGETLRRCTVMLAEAHWRLGDLVGAAELLIEQAERARADGDHEQHGMLANNLGILYGEMGDAERAEDSFRRALETGQQAGDPVIEASSWSNLARVALMRDQATLALEYIDRALERGAGHSRDAEIGRFHQVKGQAHAADGDAEAAMQAFEAAIEFARIAGNRADGAVAHAAIGELLIDQGESIRAVAVLREALAELEPLGLPSFRHQVHSQLRRALAETGDLAGALEHAEAEMAAYKELLDQDQAREVLRLGTLFELSDAERRAELAAREAQVARLESERQRARLIALLLAVLLAATVAAGLFVRLRQKSQSERAAYLRELRFKREFAAMLVHDLRSPLQRLLVTAERLEDLDGSAELKEISAGMLSTAETMRVLVDDLLALAREERGELELELRPSNLEDCVDEAVEQLSAVAHRKGIRLVREGEALEPIEVDHRRMVRVVSNLLDNAVRHSAKGGKITIGVDHWKDDRDQTWQRLKVRDRGRGIPEDEIERIFQPYVRSGSRSDGSSGYGLGLAISRLIVRAHGGRITAGNRPDGPGAEFVIVLPTVPRS